MSKYTIGIDLGGTTMTAGLVDESYKIVGKVTWATRLPRPAEDLEKAMADLCRTVAKENKVDFADVKYVGIGTPGSVNFTTGFVGFNTNFGYYDWNLGPDLEALLGCKVYVENDANAAAYGEYIAGGAKGYNDAVVITLGTGIGSGIILGGKILRGFNFAAGEMGHNVIVKDGIQCTCGRKGCWERYASASALTRETKAAMQAHKESIMWKMTPDIDHVNAKLSFDAAAKGDAVAKAVVDSWIEYVGVGGHLHRRRCFQPGRNPAGPRPRLCRERDQEHHDRQVPQNRCLHPAQRCRRHRCRRARELYLILPFTGRNYAAANHRNPAPRLAAKRPAFFGAGAFGRPYHLPNWRPGGVLVYAQRCGPAAQNAGALPGKRCARLPVGQRLQHAVCR